MRSLSRQLRGLAPRDGDLWPRLSAVLGLACIAVLLGLVLTRMHSTAHTTSLSGSWQVLAQDGSSTPIQVPFRGRPAGLPPEQPLRLVRTVDLPLLKQPTLLIEGTQYNLQVRWDNDVVAVMGDLPGRGPVPYSSQLLVPLPSDAPADASSDASAPGPHTLELLLTGSHGSVGLWGDLLLADASTLQRYTAGRTAERIALTSTLAMAAILGLVVAGVRPTNREFLWFGMFCAVAATAVFAGDESFWLVSEDLDLRLRTHAAAAALLPGTGLFFLSYFIAGSRGGRSDVVGAASDRFLSTVVFNVGCIIAVFALAWPNGAALRAVELVSDVSTLLATALGLRWLVMAVRKGDRSASPLLFAASVLSLAMVVERALAELAVFNVHLLLPAFLAFLASTVGGLVLGRSDLADRYGQLVRSARDAILVILPNGQIEEGNASATRLAERDPVGLKATKLVLEEDQPVMAAHLQERSEGLRRCELRLRSPVGRTLTVESIATDLPEGRTMLVMRDITARRQVEASMLSAARMETVAIIAGGIAHDFNNAMTALMAHIGLLSLRVTEDKDRDRLTRMEAVIRRAAHMTRRLLTLARGGDTSRTAINLAVPAHSAVELTRSMLPAGVTIKERIEADLPDVLGSEDDLEQAVLNLLINARDAVAASGGTIRLRLRRFREAGLPAGVRVDVEDDGPGVPDSVIDSIWEPFFTTKGEGQGTGLGLSVVARVIREHGGQVRLSHVRPHAANGRQGSRFTILLPTRETAASLVVDSGRHDQRVWVVDDEVDIREMVKTELVSRGYHVWAAASAEEVMAHVETQPNPPDVLVTDVVMSGEDGIWLAQQLTGRYPGLRVLIASGFIPQHTADLDPDWQMLSKPFSAEHLSVALRRAILSAADVSAAADLPTQEQQKEADDHST